MKVKKEEQARKVKIRAKPRDPTLLGKTMMFLPLAHHQMEMKRQICA